MKEHRIIIEIGNDGRITADADGFTGDACLKELERLLSDTPAAWAEVSRKPDPSEVRLASRRTQTQTSGKGGKS